MKNFEFITTEKDTNTRIDKFLIDNLPCAFSRSYIQKLIQNNSVTANGNFVNKNFKLSSNQSIKINISDPEPLDVAPENIKLDLIYEDDDLLIVNKPKDMVVHPAPGNHNKTLVNALLFHCKNSLSGINGIMRPGIVHRIDKDTSGLLIVAKNDVSHNFIANQIKEHGFTRIYEAVVIGNLKNNEGTITTNLGRHKTNRKKMTVVAIGGKSAITHYKVIKRYNGFTHIQLKLETGRTHQIRVHMAYLGHPVLGDEIYGNSKKNKMFPFLKGQCLHAKFIGFIHPSTKKYIEFTSALPDYFSKVLKHLSK